MKQKFSMSRRTAGWLMALLVAFVVVHYASSGSTAALSRAVTGQPAIQVAMRGEITSYSDHSVSLALEDPHGNLTTLSRNVQLTDKTQYVTPGEPPITGPKGMKYLKPGYRVYVRGQGTADNQVIAQLVHVSFPPITGTIRQISPSVITVSIPNQPQAANIALTSHTAIYVPQGDWSKLTPGATVRVWVMPQAHSESQGLVALSVMVLSQETSSANPKV
ncbi:MAG: hypothetical protein C7B44_15835 [Sulfobacillus thermosulfidooxidans]|uniref:DUF5666 domain-containing protein n=1 Tax=Sulfobacillus thermotolerans TaxID=338644 RepID=A0ABM6RN67_9FIRM|nr:DUF5666 domain-containing protein [Sulfobacillus sp. hq2]AUW92773.1 hypothetical protein BXT84_01395 [Sulfobacillus thermotolerans]POB09923.1 hypothetical protein CO251_11915 [Sulfobacillus sp. hq2]PSR31239.1 MAG: hypothetical protein C7B44_15835 [Sulfobacillus thermosulfidooxidans]